MERKKGSFLPNSDCNCIREGKGHAGRSRQQGGGVHGKTATGHCSKPLHLATCSDVHIRAREVLKITALPRCLNAQHSALVKENTGDALEPRKTVTSCLLSFFLFKTLKALIMLES